MKLKSLFLASLAAMAMVSCSNEDDQIVNNVGEKNALLNFGITVPMATTTRGTTTDKQDSELVGTTPENKINTIMFSVTNATGQTYDSPIYTLDQDFQKTTEGVYVMNDAVNVYPGISTITVWVNGAKTETGTVSAYANNELDGLGDIARIDDKDNGNFMMSGSEKGVDIEANKNNTVTVKVTRLAAKLVESTPDYVFQKTLTNTDNSQSVDVNITFTDYTFANLNKKSNVLEGTVYYDEQEYFQPYVASKVSALWKDTFVSTKKVTDKTTYCLENDNVTNATYIHYMAKVTLANGTDANLMDTDGTFYVYEGTMYSWTALRKVVVSQGIIMGDLLDANNCDQSTDNATLQKKLGVQKYTEGICYYSAPIQTANAAKILRNNWYLLNIKSVKGLGLPDVGTPDKDPNTTLLLTTEVKKWVVNTNDFEL